MMIRIIALDHLFCVAAVVSHLIKHLRVEDMPDAG
jgi:hypothetical protein